MKQLESKDIRVTVISKIWAYATVMLAISVLFSGPGRNWRVIFLPVAITSGTTICSIAIWKSGRNRNQSNFLPSQTLDDLELRIANLETIAISGTYESLQNSQKTAQAAENQ